RLGRRRRPWPVRPLRERQPTQRRWGRPSRWSVGVDEGEGRFGGYFFTNERAGGNLAQAATEHEDRTGKAERLPRHDLPLEPGLLDGGQVTYRRPAASGIARLVNGPLTHGKRHSGRLRQGLDDHHAGHYRLAREVAGEVRFVVAHQFDALELIAIERDESVDHEERVAMG